MSAKHQSQRDESRSRHNNRFGAAIVSTETQGVAVEMCSGLGGIGIALRALGYQVAAAYDSWPEAVAIYNHNFLGEAAKTCNILSAKGRQMVAADLRQIGAVEILAAGPPCKGFSQLRNGRHDGRNGHNRVLAAMPDYVAIIKPRLFLLENVPDLIRHRNGKTLTALVKRLERPSNGLRYHVEFKVYDAAMFGTPQARRRILILGTRDGKGTDCLPESGPDLAPLFAAVRHRGTVPTELKSYLAILRDPENDSLISARQALSDLPRLGPGEPEIERPYASEAKTAFQRWARVAAPEELRNTQTPAVKADTLNRLQHVPPGGCARAIPSDHLNGLTRRFDSAYRRLHPDAPSTALSTKYDCVYHYGESRSLSVREYARLQGIPDRITFPADLVCRRSAYEMVGNSVPPLLIERVLRKVLGVTSRGRLG
jgi:DNA (cytosine-5)-methyltransferase 1